MQTYFAWISPLFITNPFDISPKMCSAEKHNKIRRRATVNDVISVEKGNINRNAICSFLKIILQSPLRNNNLLKQYIPFSYHIVASGLNKKENRYGISQVYQYVIQYVHIGRAR